MTSLDSLLRACAVDENALLNQTQGHVSDWDRWLAPLSEAHPCGNDAGYDDDFQQIREEVNKLSGIDTDLICTLAEKLLTTVSKDVRVVTFYAWARLHRDGERGLAEGLELLAGMLRHFGVQLWPQRDRSRKSALEWLGSSRFLDSLSLYPEVDLSVMQRIAGALMLTEQAIQRFDEDARPQFSALYQALENRLVQSGGAGSLVPQTSREEHLPGAPLTASAPVMNAVSSGRDLLDQAKVLAKYLRDQEGGWLAGHHLMKSVRWDTLTELPPLDASGRTRLVPPKPDHRAHLKRLYLQQSWSELLEQTDTLMAQGVNHLWLDVQWYTWQALVKLDSDGVRADIICRDLQGLLARLPGLEALAFNDGTPFADEVTQSWIVEKVQQSQAGWQQEPVAAVPDADGILTLEPEVLALADSEGFEAALNWLQTRPGLTSPREQWLMRLLMARVAEQYGKNEMALHLLGELDSRSQSLTLQQWTPELMFEVKARRLKLLRTRAVRSEADKKRLQPELDALLSGLISLDPARAAVLCN
ncbi:type VI secretion system protein TssA [Citrobacter amalonaticus]|uniref:Type VI secretion system protein TssA n=1 Tax=Citrobacter amalonaticus TaxID=35703 RepID=A0A2S4RQU8_CITAM|nr:type VI secretion system protein TssA [Citrobacter amalonaticus]POT57517.1 type VI secretion system protein TssA [Citrobacter amalonaticus]POT76956.1 type VI secretion system protein TssA [Citrobacter amalonaticus]POU60213.1 type VI secretion system protein TssA [Citrobacter amalonaticus]POV06191.1 type VI secretion system protein TssA [Citrobacter amalonaticus]